MSDVYGTLCAIDRHRSRLDAAKRDLERARVECERVHASETDALDKAYGRLIEIMEFNGTDSCVSGHVGYLLVNSPATGEKYIEVIDLNRYTHAINLETPPSMVEAEPILEPATTG
jgi:hypothetical protein